MKNRDYLNGKQYPNGFRSWASKVSNITKGLQDYNVNLNEAYKDIDLESWLPYFMDGMSPTQAVMEDYSNL